MPGAGKSTLGPKLAKKLSMQFIDTDDIIEDQQHASLAEIIESKGEAYFAEAEEKATRSVPTDGYVVATGGSLATNKKAMEHLKSTGLVIYLEIDLWIIKERLGPERLARIIGMEGQDLEKLFKDRNYFYEHYADAKLKLEPYNKASNSSRLQKLVEGIL